MTAAERRMRLALREIRHIADQNLVSRFDERPEVDRVLDPSDDELEQIYSLASIALMGGIRNARRRARAHQREVEDAS